MTTALSIIESALRNLGAIASGETLTANEANDALAVLNRMLDAWRNESLMAWTINDVSGPVAASTASVTVGAGGNLDVPRPVDIDNARIRLNGVDYRLEVIDQSQWASIRVKTLNSNIPRYVYDNGNYPLRTLTFWPIPTQDLTLILGLKEPLSSLDSLATVLAMPPGYEECLVYGLAIRLAPEYGLAIPPSLPALYKAARQDLKRVNHQVPRMRSELSTGRRYNIYSDF